MTKPRRKRPIPPQAYYYAPPQPVYPAAPPPADGTVVAGVQTLSAKNATVARVSVRKITDWNKGPDYEFAAADSSKREQGDRYDERAGELLALGRAYARLGRELVSAGNKRTQEVLRAQAAELAAVEEKRNAPKQPVHRRTREEWVEMQRSAARTVLAGEDGLAAFSADLSPEDVSRIKGYQEAGVVPRRRVSRDGVQQMADSLGLVPADGEFSGNLMSAYEPAQPLPEDRDEIRIELTHGRYITREGDWLIMWHPSGNSQRLARA